MKFDGVSLRNKSFSDKCFQHFSREKGEEADLFFIKNGHPFSHSANLTGSRTAVRSARPLTLEKASLTGSVRC